MKQKLLTLFALLLGVCSGAWAEAIDDLKTIATDYVFIADNITANGTQQLTANNLYDGNVIFAPTGNSVAKNKGSVTFDGNSHLNSLRLKNTQDQLCFKVGGPCTVTFYTQSHSGRGIQVGSTAGGTQYGSQTASTSEWSCDITAAGVVYLSSYNGDFYFAGFKVTYPKTGQPTIETNPVSAEYSQGAVATALSVTATAANSGALSYQWYKNETNQSVLDSESATAIDGATNSTYVPSTTSAGTTYYFCKVTEEGNANVATTRMAKILVNPAGFDVAFSLGEVTGTVGTLPAGASHVNSFTIPENKTLYKEGYTLTAWNDGEADHAIGATIPITANTNLTPVFSDNTKELGDHASEITWDFQTNNNAPAIALEGVGATGLLVAQTTIGGVKRDTKLDIDATSGKLNNTSYGDWAQANEGTKLTIPVTEGAVVQAFVMNEGSNPITFGGIAGSYNANLYSYTATADGNLDIVMGDQNWLRYVTVTYPSKSAVYNLTTAEAEIPLTKANIDAYDYLETANMSWNTSKTYDGLTGDFPNLGGETRTITVKVKGVASFEVRNQNSNATRSYYITVGDGSKQTITHGGTGVESSGIFTTGTTDEITITISGKSSNSTYPTKIILYQNVVEKISTKADRHYASYVTTNKLDFASAEGITAYIATGLNGGGTAVELTPVDIVPASTPIIVKTETQGATVNVPVTTAEPNNVSANKLVAGDGTTAATSSHYYLANDQFHQANAGTLQSGKAYLLIEGNAARNLSIGFADDATAIKTLNNSKTTDGFYNLAGQRVAAPTKGLYIANGKKVIIK